MNGILFLSSESGMLLFCEYYDETFGIKNRFIGEDPMQLSAFIFTIFKNSQLAISNEHEISELQYFTLVRPYLIIEIL